MQRNLYLRLPRYPRGAVGTPSRRTVSPPDGGLGLGADAGEEEEEGPTSGSRASKVVPVHFGPLSIHPLASNDLRGPQLCIHLLRSHNSIHFWGITSLHCSLPLPVMRGVVLYVCFVLEVGLSVDSGVRLSLRQGARGSRAGTRLGWILGLVRTAECRTQRIAHWQNQILFY